jgi:hypothetical protein
VLSPVNPEREMCIFTRNYGVLQRVRRVDPESSGAKDLKELRAA